KAADYAMVPSSCGVNRKETAAWEKFPRYSVVEGGGCKPPFSEYERNKKTKPTASKPWVF
ncbi:TPA: hypothetical protein IMJ33_005972, partial [Salmonella enterica]|nr:hypothetical protein [Salmonella enterica]